LYSQRIAASGGGHCDRLRDFAALRSDGENRTMSLIRKLECGVAAFAHRRLRRPMAILATALLAATAAGQEFRSDPVDDKLRLYGAKVQRFVLDRAGYTAEKQVFDEYFQKYYFPSMTQYGPDDLARLGDNRYRLFKNFLWATSNPELQQNLTNMAFRAMGAIVVSKNPPPYHPAVRFNAVLTLGMLDETYAIDAGANARPPKPLPAATKALTFIVDTATTSEQFPPPVILGALIGLERHAQYRDALEPGAADTIQAALLKLVNHDEPIQELDPDAYAWMRLRAANALASLGGVGQNNAVHNALIKLAGDFKSLDDRCQAAALLGKLTYEGAKVDGAATATSLLKLAREVGADEGKRAEEFHETVGTSGAYASRSDLYGGSDEVEERFPRRHVLARLSDLKTGLQAAKPIVPQDAQATIDAVLKAMEPVITAATDSDISELRITEAIGVMAEAIDLATTAEEPAADEAAAL
jgi:hypothetical protein